MQIEDLPHDAQKELGGINMVATWFSGYFTRQAMRVVERAANNNQKGPRP